MRRVWVAALAALLGGCADDGPGGGAAPGSTGAADTGPAGGDAGGGDTGPASVGVVLDAPDEGAVFRVGEAVALEGRFTGGAALATLDATVASSLDGVVWQGHPTAAGAVEATLEGLRSGVHELTLRAAGPDGKVAAASVTVRVNAPPGAPVVSIDPAEPGTDDDLVALVLEPATDPDVADTVGYTYAWTRDGAATEVGGKTVSRDLTKRGEVWEVRVVASDGWHPGEAATAAVTIANAAPVAGGALVLPSSGTTDSTLTCSATGVADADGDAVALTFEWLVNGEVVGEGETLGGEHFSKGDAVVCRVTPSDGTDAGEPVESAAVPILNSAPTVGQVTLTPAEGLATTQFTCTWDGLDDPDGEPVNAQVVWVLDGQELPGTTSQALVPVSVGAKKGQALRCRVRPSDGQGAGTPADSAVVILGNAAPVVASVVVQGGAGGEAREADVLTCESAAPEDGDGDPVGVTWGWLVDGVPVLAGGSPVQTATLGGAHFDKGQVVQCTATPHDGQDAGATVTSKNAIAVVDTAPALAAVEIAPKAVTRTTTLTCTATGFTDPDPADAPAAWQTPDPDDTEAPGVAIQWLAGGAPIGGETGPTFVPSALAPGDAVSCRATPHDGQLAGAPLTSAVVTLANVKPKVASVTLGPEPAYGDSVLVCSPAGWADPDGDPEGYAWAWTKNGAPVVADGPTLDGSHFGKGDTLLCTATPFDGWESGGAVASGPLTIQNQAPSLAGATLTPASGGKKDTFTCAPDGVADADELDPVYYSYTWRTAAGEPLGLAGASASGAQLPLGVPVVCEVTPFDGEAYGEPAVSNPATVINNPPTLAGAVIEPTAPAAGDTLTCTAVGFADPDGDAPVLAIQWYVNAQPLPGQTGATLPGGTLSKGQKVFCRITPGDGLATGTPKTSAELTVGNAAPSAPVVEISPAVPEAGQDLGCAVIGGAEDPDGDLPTIGWAWLLDGALVPELDGPTVPGALLTQCGQWTCVAVATDPDGGESAPGTDTVSLDAGQGVAFAGADHRVVSGPASTLAVPGGSVTVEAWVRRAPGGGDGVLAERMVAGKGYRLSLLGGAPVATVGDGTSTHTLTAADGLPEGLYTHVAMTYDGGVLRLFVGGVKQPGDVTAIGVAFEGGGALVLGNDAAQGAPFAGALDEVRVSSTARYSTSFTPKVSHTTDLATLVYYPFEADGPAIAYDKSGKQNDGVLLGATHGPGICNPANQAPSPPVVEIQPVAPGAGAALTCATVTPAVDPDGDLVAYAYSWTKDGVVQPSQVGKTVAAGTTGACEVWACEVVASDGAAQSAPATAAVEVQDVSSVSWYGYDEAGSEGTFDQLAEKEEVAVVFPKVPGAVKVTAVYVKMDAGAGATARVYGVSTATEGGAHLWQGAVASGVFGFQKLTINGGAGVEIADGKALRVSVRSATYLGLAAYYRTKGFGTHLIYACNAYFPGVGCWGTYGWTAASAYVNGYWEIHADLELPGGGVCL